MINDSHLKKLSKIKILISDVDGILTDGRILVSDQSEFKFFHVEDALATSLLNLADIPISFISARFSNATKTRLDELKIKHYFQGYLNKVKALDKIIGIYNLKYEDIEKKISIEAAWNDLIYSKFGSRIERLLQ